MHDRNVDYYNESVYRQAEFDGNVLVAIFLIVVCLVLGYTWIASSPEGVARRVEYANENGYSWYVDGQEVDPKFLNLDDYILEFDFIHERVLVTPKD